VYEKKEGGLMKLLQFQRDINIQTKKEGIQMNMRMRRSSSGFTLMELLIVVIVVGILATIALPQFRNMVNRARMAEARNTVGAILTAELAYFQENTAFTNNLGQLDVTIPPAPPGNFTYAVLAVNPGPPADVQVRATGRAGTPVAGRTVTGTIDENGARTITEP